MSGICPRCKASVRTARQAGRGHVICPTCGVTLTRVARTGSGSPIVGRRSPIRGGTHVGLAEAPTVAAVLASPAAPAESLAGVPTAPVTRSRMPSGVPGYRVERSLGHGGMGTVYLARQLSLDRPVALKVMSRKWAADPVFVARFTREAFAAALLNHPNVVQIYDIGEHNGLRYFSMEYVPGRTLAEHLKAEGRIDSETAVGYVLQAARGLEHAHERGMIHRDVKPENLLLDDQGRVKVADLGLVKTPKTPGSADRLSDDPWPEDAPAEMTGTRIALGTPAYMAPEQCRDAATVDHRADIYSLGCTLYVLVTGRPPFDGTTAVELMSKHAYEPIVPPEAIVGRVPKELSVVILKMLAKEAGDRFQSMGEVIRTLEQWLGVRYAGTFNPRDEQIEQLETFVAEFTSAPSAVTKSRVVAWSLSTCFLIALVMLFFGRLNLAFGLSGFVVQSALAYFVFNGLRQRTYLFRRTRAALFGLTLWDYSLMAAGTALFGVLLWGLGLLASWLGFGALALAAAGLVHVIYDRSAEAERANCLAGCRKLLRRMRLNGLSEDDLRLFVAKYAGQRWEEFFEALFGYEAKIAAREVLLRGHSAGIRDKFAAWREPLLAALDRWEQSRRDSSERKFLHEVESAGLAAEGLSASQAHVRAASQAHALVTQAGLIRTGVTVPNLSQMLGRGRIEPPLLPQPRPSFGDRLATLFTGPITRALCAGILLGLFTAWVTQNVTRRAHGTGAADEPFTQPLTIMGIAPRWTGWVADANIGWAGVLLLASLFFRGPRTGALVMLGAIICALGPSYGIHTVDPVQPAHVAFLLGSIFVLVGYRIGEHP